MPPVVLPEFFAILGTDIFLAMSILSCLLDRHLPKAVPYVYQVVALAGFGHLLVSRGFMTTFTESMRFWYCLFYLLVALANVVALNLYLMVSRKRLKLAKIFFGAVTAPAAVIAAFFVSSYAGAAEYQLIALPTIPLELSYLAIVGFDVAVIAIGLSAFFSLNWNRVAVICSMIIFGTSICTFLKPPGWYLVLTASAIVLGVATALILSTSVYVFIRMRREAQRKTQKEVKKEWTLEK